VCSGVVANERSAKVLVLQYRRSRFQRPERGVDSVAFPARFRRTYEPALDFRLSDVSWGVKRRPGFSEFDDPQAHATSTAHAFVSGNDALAICGYRPYRRRRHSSVTLAAPSEQNPECERCRSILPLAVALVVQADVAGQVQTVVGPQMVDQPSPLLRLADHFEARLARSPRRRAARTARMLGPVGLSAGKSRRRSRSRAKTRAADLAPQPLFPELTPELAAAS
jgi:hypothetical protein